ESCGCPGGGSGSGGGCGACANCTYITQTPCAILTNEQALSLLQTGLLKNTTGTGVLSIATIGVDYSAPITVREVDGVPSITPVTIIEFDQADGFAVSNPGTGIARINFTGGGGSPFNLTVQDSDGSPTFSNINTLQFPSVEGFTVSNPSAGVAKI